MIKSTYICAVALVMNVIFMHGAADSSQYGLMQPGQEITASVARTIYEQYAEELRDKSHEELNKLLSLVSDESTYNPSRIVALVYAGADPNSKSRYGTRQLLSAIWKKNDALVRFLLVNNADPNQIYSIEAPDFWFCSSISLLDECVRFGADLKITKRSGENILYHVNVHSAETYSTAFLKRAIQLGASVKSISSNGYTPLTHLALHMKVYDVASVRMFRERAYLYLIEGSETHHRVTGGGYVGCTAADILRKRAQLSYENTKCKEVCAELAHTIDRYPLRSLQEYIIRCAILDARDTDPHVAEPAQELIKQVQEPESYFSVATKKIFDRCSDELSVRKKERPGSSDCTKGLMEMMYGATDSDMLDLTRL